MEITDKNLFKTLTAPIFFMKITIVQHHCAETLGTEFHPNLSSRHMEAAVF
jgi:hypothetical protein